MARFDSLTQYLTTLQNDSLGDWIIDRLNDGTPEHPIQMPYVNYSDMVHHFIADLYAFCENHPEYEHTKYNQTLEAIGIKWGSKEMASADVSGLDAKGLIALLMGAVRAERFCDGALLGFFENGSILRWLERLQQIDLTTTG